MLDRGRSEEERREKPEPIGAFLTLAIDTRGLGVYWRRFLLDAVRSSSSQRRTDVLCMSRIKARRMCRIARCL